MPEAAAPAPEAVVEAPVVEGAPAAAEAVVEATPDVAKPKEPELAPKAAATEKETAYGRAVRKREVELVARQQRFSQEKATIEREKAAVAKDRVAIEADRTQVTSLISEAKADPFAFLAKHAGIREDDLARRWINGGRPTPQEEARKAEEARQAELKKTSEEIAELRTRLEREDKAKAEAAQKAETEARNAKIVSDFAAHSTKLADRFPLAARAIAVDQAEAISDCNLLAMRMIESPAEKRRGPELWTAVLERYNAKLVKLSGGSPAAPQGSEATKKTEKPGAQVSSADAANSGKNAPTLTGKGASQRSVIIKDDDPLLDILDPQKGRERAERAIEDALKKHKAAQA